MLEVTGNLWTYPADVRVITTNGTVKKNGDCVMGRGCAAEAKQRWLQLPLVLGERITKLGNVVHFLGEFKNADLKTMFGLWSFPVKHQWHEKADLTLIARSAEQLVNALDPVYFNDRGHVIVLPRPGCGNGSLDWKDVKPILAPILDDRFHVITWK